MQSIKIFDEFYSPQWIPIWKRKEKTKRENERDGEKIDKKSFSACRNF